VLAVPALLVAAGCVFEIYCQVDLTRLPALKADPMAELELPGTELISQETSSETIGFLTDRTAARIIRKFRILEPKEAESVLADAVEYAESSLEEVAHALDRPVVKKLLELVRLRNTHPSFDGTLEVNIAGGGLLHLVWRHDQSTCGLKVDLTTGQLDID
jgi:hypothetical protein